MSHTWSAYHGTCSQAASYTQFSVDRHNSSLPYCDPKQTLVASCWGCNASLSDMSDTARKDYFDVLENLGVTSRNGSRAAERQSLLLGPAASPSRLRTLNAKLADVELNAAELQVRWANRFSHSFSKQRRRNYVEGRPGTPIRTAKGLYLNRQQWSGDGSDRLSNMQAAESFFKASGGVCAVTGVAGQIREDDGTLHMLDLQCDRYAVQVTLCAFDRD